MNIKLTLAILFLQERLYFHGDKARLFHLKVKQLGRTCRWPSIQICNDQDNKDSYAIKI